MRIPLPRGENCIGSDTELVGVPKVNVLIRGGRGTIVPMSTSIIPPPLFESRPKFFKRRFLLRRYRGQLASDWKWMLHVYLRRPAVLTKLSVCALPANVYICTTLGERFRHTIFWVMCICGSLLRRRTFEKYSSLVSSHLQKLSKTNHYQCRCRQHCVSAR